PSAVQVLPELLPEPATGHDTTSRGEEGVSVFLRAVGQRGFKEREAPPIQIAVGEEPSQLAGGAGRNAQPLDQLVKLSLLSSSGTGRHITSSAPWPRPYRRRVTVGW